MLKIDTLPNVPRWAALGAHIVPLVTLPSGLWRIAQVAGLPVAEQFGRNGREVVVAVLLTLITEGLALLTLGLVRPWGEIAPRWLPLIGGRRVHTLAAVIPALLGVAALCTIGGWFTCSQAAGLIERVTQTPTQQVLLVVCYSPLLAWAPLLAATTVAYYRRRTMPCHDRLEGTD
ncbi:hypothetical protein [Streptomyces roseochromogenus]|uniref:Uncharacterized protein n=1 Tax=Streptomyces roseochromogenus subsp. oscitans DS 12.976 TaxID=1352936 RepID=V6KWC6_STRRC|nr:hypothetical protein [Streptomyces roseochromogenus]EST36475.1 hypothetical protein M878_01965 [Streptomyces roseochromogenus subsp. oscitans DS 12.976]